MPNVALARFGLVDTSLKKSVKHGGRCIPALLEVVPSFIQEIVRLIDVATCLHGRIR